MKKKILAVGIIHILIIGIFLSIVSGYANAENNANLVMNQTDILINDKNGDEVSQITLGETITIKATIHNIGSEDSDPTDVWIWICCSNSTDSITTIYEDKTYSYNFTMLERFSAVVIPANNERTFNVTWKTDEMIDTCWGRFYVPPGTYFFKIRYYPTGYALEYSFHTEKNSGEIDSDATITVIVPTEPAHDYPWFYAICGIIFIVIIVIFGVGFFKHRESLKTPEKLKEEKIRKHKALWKTQQYKETEQQSYLDKWREEMKKERIVSGATVAEHVCPMCGAKVDEFALLCPECGTKLTEERWRQSQKASYPPSEEIPVERETEPVTFEPDKELKLIKVRCPVCKHEMEIEDTGRPLKIVCEKCGAKGTLR